MEDLIRLKKCERWFEQIQNVRDHYIGHETLYS